MIPIVLVAIAYVVGIIWGLYLEFYLGVALFFVTICVILFFKRDIKVNIIIIIFIILVGLLYSSYRKYNYQNKYIEGPISLDVIIDSDYLEKEYYNVYTVKNGNDKFLLYADKHICKLELGCKVHLTGTFEKPQVKRNTGGFDYSKYLYSKNTYGIIKSKNIEIIEMPKYNFIHDIQINIKRIYKSIMTKECASLLSRNYYRR